MSELPRGPWLNLSVDICGSRPAGEYFLVTVDEHSGYSVVEIARSVSADSVISVIRRVFATTFLKFRSPTALLVCACA